jgi:RHS repeat-associated protein
MGCKVVWSAAGPSSLTYTYRITGGGLEASDPLMVNRVTPPPPTLFTITGGGVKCDGSNVTIGLSDSEQNFNYQLYRNTGSGYVAVEALVAGTGNALSWPDRTDPGTYKVTAKRSGCSSCATVDMTGTATIWELTRPVASPAGLLLRCEGQSITLTNTITLQAGVAYNWREDGITIPGATGSTYTISSIGVGDHVYDVEASKDGCSKYSLPVQIQGNKKPTAGYIADRSLGLCTGEKVTLTATDEGNYTYAWKNGSTLVGSEKSYLASATGNYTLEVTNANLTTCKTVSPIIPVTVTAIPVAGITPFGATTVCTGTVELRPTNTLSGYSYQWTRNNNTVPGATTQNYLAPSTGDYRLIITHNGCPSSPSSPVAVKVADIQGDVVSTNHPSFCQGDSTTLIAYYDDDYVYQWRKNGVNIPNETQPQLKVKLPGSYTVSITRYGICNKISEAITVSTSAAPAATITASTSTTFCFGGSVVLKGSTGSSYTYEWFRDGIPIDGQGLANLTATVSGMYTLTTRIGSCATTSAGMAVTATPLPLVEIAASGPTAICFGDTIKFRAYGTKGTYQWKNASGNTSARDTTSSFATTSAGTYRVMVTKGACSSESNLITVTIKPVPSAVTNVTDATGNSSLPAGTRVLFNAVGPADAEIFVWNTPAGTNIIYDDIKQQGARLSFYELGEKVISVSAKKNGCLGAPFQKILMVTELVTAVASEIPADVKVTPDRQGLAETASLPKALNTFTVGEWLNVFPGCGAVVGHYYVGFKLRYDFLADKSTSVNWTALVDIEFTNGSFVETKALKVDMVTQTFISTLFVSSLIPCDQSYKYRIKTKVTNGGGVLAPEQNITLQLLLFKKSTDTFDPGFAFHELDFNVTNETIAANWDYRGNAATSFDIEWVYIDEKEAFSGTAVEAFTFKEPVRISRPAIETQFVHKVYYPKGTIWYRMRATGINPQSPSHRILGNWHYAPSDESVNHEEKKNWTVQSVFAEDGKYKKIMNYYDGTLRQRQALTNLSSENLTLVGETLYDFEGRKAVDVLPVPSADVSLKFKPAFNEFEIPNEHFSERTSKLQKKYHYDNRSVVNNVMKQSTGAANYYSGTNVINTPHKNYVPHADGYVYSQTEYLNDGTGRVLKQSGVGPMFAMDGGKVTRYFYAEASPTELIRLFGKNVGKASHYKKNVTVDANDQVSVSYVDQTGRVIATALAGDIRKEGTVPTTLVDPLPSYTALPSAGVNIDLSSKNIISDGKLSIVHKILNEAPNTSYTFNYDLSSIHSQISGFGCFACVYELKIAITDPDGKPVTLPVLAGNTDVDRLSYQRRDLTTANCNVLGVLDTIQINNLLFTEIGDYTIVKTLSVQEKSVGQIINDIKNHPNIITGKQVIASSYQVSSEDCAICLTIEACPDGQAIVDEAVSEIATLDCENIRQGIIDKLKLTIPAPTDEQIEDDPDYCAYRLCMADKDSDIFEKNLARVLDWSTAVSKGYDKLGNVHDTNPLYADPFFADENLSGHDYKFQMNILLTFVTVAVINGDKKTGPLASVTDPTGLMSHLYQVYGTDKTTGQVIGPYHVLYFDLMHKRWKNQITETEYNKALNEQRWTFFRNFYLETKRKLKRDVIDAYKNCPLALAKLKEYDYFTVNAGESMEVTEQRATEWGKDLGIHEDIGIGVDVSAQELDMRIANMQAECNKTFSENDVTFFREKLRLYFNGNKENFLRLIFEHEVNVNQLLKDIETRLMANYSCSLDAVDVSDPIVCVANTTHHLYKPENKVANANFLTSGCSDVLQYLTSTGAVQTACFAGWKSVWGSPLIRREGPTSFELSGGDCAQDALMNTLATPVVNGKKYMLKFSYREPVNYLSNAFIELASTPSFQHSGGGTQIAFRQTQAGLEDAQSENSMIAVAWPVPKCPARPTPSNRTDRLWSSQFSLYTSQFKTYQTIFTATADAQYLFFYVHQIDQGDAVSFIFKDVELRELEDPDTICYQYALNTPTMQLWTYTPDWAAEILRCNQRAQVEKDSLIAFATRKYMDEQASIYNNAYKTNCLSKAVEKLRYTFTPKEYHYTLYYYDQAGNLVQTVPPEGVVPLDYAMANSADPPDPGHKLITRYEYTSVNQLLSQSTPDAGVSKFFYNKKGQLRFSRNAQQVLDNKYSYTKYDAHGRIVETGEMAAAISGTALLQYIEDARFPAIGVPELPSFALTDITRTSYDRPNEEIASQLIQQHLRGRVSRVEVTDKAGPDKTVTYYSYDIHGNVKSLVQQIPGLDFKRTDYVYDLISGNVNYVFYQHRKADQFIQKYTYDSDNRVKTVSTSSDAYLFNKEAEYAYYAHGPLARVELGEYAVQGQDYIYTLQGWVKGVNMPFSGDPGQDGVDAGKDVYAYTLGYYQNDYKPSGANIFLPDTRDQMWTRFNTLNGTFGLYNGNISWMVTDLAKIGEVNNSPAKGMQAMVYRYDQLNRIKKTYSLPKYTSGTGFDPRSGTPPYDESFTYDANGNIKLLKRHDAAGMLKDDFNYQYYLNSNKLRNVTPLTNTLEITSGAVTSNTTFYRDIIVKGTAYVASGSTVELVASESISMAPDFTVQSGANFTARLMTDEEAIFIYQYDAIGNLVKDHERNVNISWTPYGKVREVRGNNDTQVVTFLYDGAGNRVSKKMVTPSGTTVTHYARDAGGNVMAVYSNTEVSEYNVYGSSRLGLYKGGVREGHQTLGKRSYELANHLGNVLAVITDKVNMVNSNFTATVARSTDYYAFGLEMSGRTFTDQNAYRYGFNGKEKDADGAFGDTSYDYGFRIYNPRIARFLSVDPLTKSYPMLTPYQFACNRPIDGIDVDGLEYYKYIYEVHDNTGAVLVKVEDYTQFKNFDYATWSKSFGPEGRGVKFVYHFYKGGEYVSTDSEWDHQQRNFQWTNSALTVWDKFFERLLRHGNFTGFGAVTFAGPLFKDKIGFNFGLKPIDMVDAIAREHDIEEDGPDYAGWMDTRYTAADIRFVRRMKEYLSMAGTEEFIDPYTKRAPSEEALETATNALILFESVIWYKYEEMAVKFEKGEITQDEYDKFKNETHEAWEQDIQLPSN